MHDIREYLNELNSLIVQYHYDAALEKFYDENIITHENENPPIIGLAAYKEAARKVFFDNVSNYSAELLNTLIVDDCITACQWHYVFDHKIWGHWDKEQLSVQKWKDGKIIHERHYYKN